MSSIQLMLFHEPRLETYEIVTNASTLGHTRMNIFRTYTHTPNLEIIIKLNFINMLIQAFSALHGLYSILYRQYLMKKFRILGNWAAEE